MQAVEEKMEEGEREVEAVEEKVEEGLSQG